MGLLGNVIGRIFSENAEIAQETKAANNEKLEAERQETKAAGDACRDAAGSIWTIEGDPENIGDVVGEFVGDIGNTIGAFGDVQREVMEDTVATVQTGMANVAADIEATGKSVVESAKTVLGTVGAFFSGIFASGNEAAEKYLEDKQ